MFGWRSARGRAILAAAAFTLLVGSITAVAVWRAVDMERRHEAMRHSSAGVASLESAHAGISEALGALASLAWTQDPAFSDLYRRAAAEIEQDLVVARDEAVAHGHLHHVGSVDDLIERIGRLREQVDPVIPTLLQGNAEEAAAIVAGELPEAWSAAYAIRADLADLVQEEKGTVAAQGAAADDASRMTLGLLIALGVVGTVGGAAVVTVLVLSVVRPLASLRASVRAIASGDLDARAEVSGPEETASLARDFNDMVDERKQAEETLRKLSRAVEQCASIVIITDSQGVIEYVNPKFTQLTGYIFEEAVGQNPRLLKSGDTPPAEYTRLWKTITSGGEWRGEFRNKKKSGESYWASASISPIRDGNGAITHFLAVEEDVTERKRAEEALREQARRDPLTGVLNHGAIVEELDSLISRDGAGTSHVVAMVDVDGMKAVNDMYGHQVGDALLLAVADALLRDGALVGRYGGDEFVALLPRCDRPAAERYRNAVLDVLAGAGLTDPATGVSVPVAVSIGLVVYPTEAGRIEELITRADSEMYAAKRRPVGSGGRPRPWRLELGRAARMVEEIVPLMMSAGDLNAKLRLVARRLSVAAGYEMVHFTMLVPSYGQPAAQTTRVPGHEEVVEAWDGEQRVLTLVRTLERTRRPLILDDPQHDQRLTDEERELVRAAGVQSVLQAPMICEDELIGTLCVASKRAAAFGPREAEFLMAIATQVTAIVRMATLVDELQSTSRRLSAARSATVMLLAAAAEAHDRTTGQHLRNVRELTEALARELGYSEEEAGELGLAGVLHDIGKIRVPDIILASTGGLSASEWDLLIRHSAWGEEMLAGTPDFELAAAIARSHHERWDGSGYPDGLAGEAIPEAATIVAVADSFDAMISDRPYRPARSVGVAVREIEAGSGRQFSPRVVEALLRLRRRKLLPRRRHRQRRAEHREKLAA